MPKITYYEALSSKITTQIFDNNTFRLHTMKPDVMTYHDADGNVIKVRGENFQYTIFGEVKELKEFEGNTISSITLRDSDGHLLQRIDHIDPGTPPDPKVENDEGKPGDQISDAYDVYNAFSIYGASALSFVFNGDRDRLYGSKKADIMDGGDSADHMFGGAGNDIISGGTGMDHLTGGGGKDLFYFKPGDGRDIVTDFHDSGKFQDLILVSKNQYAMLEKHQSGHDVILDFGWGDQLIIEDAKVNHIGKDDFQLY